MRLCAAALGLLVSGVRPVSAQYCDYLMRPAAEAAMPFLGEGAVVQAFCASCRDRRARKIVVEEAEIRVVDTVYVQIWINGAPADPAFLYAFDPRRRRWRNLGLAIACHEEDDVPPTLPADKVAE